MLEKQITYDHSITEFGHIQVRQITRIMEDGKEISKTYHRHVLCPGDDLTGQDERAVAIAKAVWTPEVIEEYKEFLKNSDIVEELEGEIK